MPMQEAELVELARHGDTAAYTSLYELFAPKVCRFLRSHLDGSQEAAEDLTSTVFLKLWRNLELYADRGVPFEAWVFRIARNALIDYLRKQSRYVADSLDDAADVADVSTGHEYDQVIDREILEEALGKLNADQRETVQLRFLDGLSAIETGIRMHRSPDAVKKLQARALVNLRRLLRPARKAAPVRFVPAAA